MSETATSHLPGLLAHVPPPLRLLTESPRDSNIVPRARLAVKVPSMGRSPAVPRGPKCPDGPA